MIWRRDRDSNPGDGLPPTHFPGVRLRPLGHLSADEPASESLSALVDCPIQTLRRPIAAAPADIHTTGNRFQPQFHGNRQPIAQTLNLSLAGRRIWACSGSNQAMLAPQQGGGILSHRTDDKWRFSSINGAVISGGQLRVSFCI